MRTIRLAAPLVALVARVAFSALLAAATAAPLGAQAAAATIDPGMTREQVVARLGTPVAERHSGSRTYLYYRNGCESRCGMQDLVMLDGDAVVDAIFRGPRRYTGESSSPAQVGPTGASRIRSAEASPAVDPAAATTLPPIAKRKPRAHRAAPLAAPIRAAGQGGIVVGTGPADSVRSAAPRRARHISTAAGAPGAAQAITSSDSGAGGRRQPGPVRVPTLPRDTTFAPPPGERGLRTLPGPVTVPTLPRDTTFRPRPDSAARMTPAPARPDSSRSPR